MEAMPAGTVLTLIVVGLTCLVGAAIIIGTSETVPGVSIIYDEYFTGVAGTPTTLSYPIASVIDLEQGNSLSSYNDTSILGPGDVQVTITGSAEGTASITVNHNSQAGHLVYINSHYVGTTTANPSDSFTFSASYLSSNTQVSVS